MGNKWLKRLYVRARYSLMLMSILHALAMTAPHDSLSKIVYRLRGRETKIGKMLASLRVYSLKKLDLIWLLLRTMWIEIGSKEGTI